MTREEEIQKLIDEETGINNYGSSDYQVGVCDGVRLADKNPKSLWINYKKKKPKTGVDVLAYNKNWIDEYSNPTGIRMGFINDKGDFASVCWWDDKECYVIISKSICEENSISFSEHIGNTEPTHWIPIPESPKE